MINQSESIAEGVMNHGASRQNRLRPAGLRRFQPTGVILHTRTHERFANDPSRQ
jgi:hypothetical protein